MVNCGKISKACGECRLRRTRCNFLKPSCTQCIRAGRLCTGYRDTDPFRDCTKLFATSNTDGNPTVTSNKEKIAKISSSVSVSPSSPVSGDQFDDSLIAITTYTLFEEDFATCYFFQNYVIDSDVFSRGTFQYLTNIYYENAVSPLLSNAISAIGTAGLAYSHKDSSMMLNAKKKYSLVLSSVSLHLSDPVLAKEDQILMVVVLLAVYEINACSSLKAMGSLNSHVNGAEALLQLRGKQQLDSAIGRELFVQARAQIITRCWQANIAVPQNIIEWSETAHQNENLEEAAATRISQICSQFCNLQMTSGQLTASCSPYDLSNSGFIIACALEIDSQLAEWEAICPSTYRYQVVALEEKPEDFYSSRYHVYNSISIATAWNEYRLVRIMVNELLLQHAQRIIRQEPKHSEMKIENQTSHFHRLAQDSTVLIAQLADDICTSVSFYLGFGSQDCRAREKKCDLKTIAGHLLLWPLYIAARTECDTDMCNWAVRRLKRIANSMGIQLAMVVADCVTNNENLPS